MIYHGCCPVKMTLVNAAEGLLKGTSNRREGVIRVRANQTNGTDYQYEDYGQHDGIFRNVLALLIAEKLGEVFHSGGVPDMCRSNTNVSPFTLTDFVRSSARACLAFWEVEYCLSSARRTDRS
jgi:hypothetical protein